MRVLAIDTATTTCSVGLVDDGRVVARRASGEPPAAQRALAAVDACLAEAGVALDAIDRIAIGRGPGSFTGLRIGLALALGLAAARGATPIGVGTLDALRHAAGGAYAAIDARRGEVFAAGPDLPAACLAPAALAERLPPGAVVVGDGALAHAALLVAAGAVIPGEPDLHVPSAAALAALAETAPGPALPLYLRAPDAVPSGSRA